MFFRHGVGQSQVLIVRNTRKIGDSDGCNPRVFLSYTQTLLMLFLVFLSPSAFAQTDEAAALKIGESDFIPSVRFDYFQTDNAFLTETNQTEATAVVISPRAEWVADRRLLKLTGIYDGNFATYSETALNYADHSLRALLNADISTRQRVLARIGVNFGHQALGTNFTRGVSDPDASQVEFINSELAGSYSYGARQARGNFTLGLNVFSRTYQNQPNLTDGAGYVSFRPFGQFSLRVSADTRAIATLRFTRTDFEDDARDRNDFSLLAGLRFAATGKSGGEFQVGASLTDFSQSTRTDETSFIAEAELFYEPTAFSRFELSASRVLDNNAGSPLDLNNVLAITDSAKLNWQHEWSSRVYHVADLSYRLENGDCPGRATFAEASGGIELNVVIQRWLHVGASFKGQSRETDLCEGVVATDADTEYESQIIGAHIRATL